MKRLFRESGIVHAPEGFTKNVMGKINTEPEKMHFKPLIGRTGRIVILLSFVVFIAISIFYEGTGDPSAGFTLPDLNLHLQFLTQINLSGGLVAALAALLVLVISDAGLNRRRYA